MKQMIRLTEGQLHRIIDESVRKVINEIGDTKRGSYMLGRAAGRNEHYRDYPSVMGKANRASDVTYFSEDITTNATTTLRMMKVRNI